MGTETDTETGGGVQALLAETQRVAGGRESIRIRIL